MVVVDPRRSETAAIADQHLFVRPGGDAALLFGLLNTLFAEGLTRDSHLPVDGLDEVRKAIAGFTAEAMSPLCAVPAEQIRQLARDFAAAPTAVCYGRMGVSTQAFGTLCHWLVQLINLVTGNLDRVGGALCTEPAVNWWRPRRAAISTCGKAACPGVLNTVASCRCRRWPKRCSPKGKGRSVR